MERNEMASNINRAEYAKAWRARNRALKLEVYNQFRLAGCSHCGFGQDDASKLKAIDAHHINPDSKHANPSDYVYDDSPIVKLTEELSKCTPVCKNCHSILDIE